MNSKKIILRALISLSFLLISNCDLVSAQSEDVNLSPIEKIDFLSDEVKEETIETDSAPIIEDQAEVAADDSSVESATEGQATDPDNASLKIFEALDQANRIEGAYWWYDQGTDEEILTTYWKDGTVYYVSSYNLAELPLTFFVDLDEQGEVRSLYLSLNDLYAYSSQALDSELNPWASLYEGGPVEDLNLELAANMTEFADQYVQLDPVAYPYFGQVSHDLYTYEGFTIDLMIEWLADNQVQANAVADGATTTFEFLNPMEETAILFGEIATRLDPNPDTSNPLLRLFPAGYIGRVVVNADQGEMVIALLSSNDEGVNPSAFQGNLAISANSHSLPSENQVMDEETFNSMIGMSVISDILVVEEEVNQAIVAESINE